MTKANIKAIIKENNQNADIKWDVHSTKDNGIVIITNDYADEVEFTITKNAGEDFEWLSVKDAFMKDTVALLIKGDTRWDDFKEWDEGIGQAVKAVVNHFYYCY